MRLTSNWAASLVGALALAFVALLFVAPPSAAVPAGALTPCVYNIKDKEVRAKGTILLREQPRANGNVRGKLHSGRAAFAKCTDRTRAWVKITAYYPSYRISGWVPKKMLGTPGH